MNQEKRLEILKALQADNPTPKTELEYGSNFELLIAVVLSAQATDKSVNEATRVLFPLANTPQAVLLLHVSVGNMRKTSPGTARPYISGAAHLFPCENSPTSVCGCRFLFCSRLRCNCCPAKQLMPLWFLLRF